MKNQEKKDFDEQMKLRMRSIIQKASWLSCDQQRTIIDAAKTNLKIQQLAYNEQLKLIAVVCSIPYAEKMLRKHGKRFLNTLENILERLHLKELVCRSFGTWNFHVCHAKKFGHNPREFKKILREDKRAFGYVVDLILDDIGLHKPSDHIFAEYNHNVMATTVAALQHTLNLLMKKHRISFELEEDGLLGKRTFKALKFCEKVLKRPLSLNSENDIFYVLDLIFTLEDIKVDPFIPRRRIKMDFNFVKKVLHDSLSRPSQLKKMRLIFNNHINVPLYADFGMKAYHQLVQTE